MFNEQCSCFHSFQFFLVLLKIVCFFFFLNGVTSFGTKISLFHNYLTLCCCYCFVITFNKITWLHLNILLLRFLCYSLFTVYTHTSSLNSSFGFILFFNKRGNYLEMFFRLHFSFESQCLWEILCLFTIIEEATFDIRSGDM